MTQLTLNLPDEVVQQAEAYARAQGKTLAALIEEILEQMVANVEPLPSQSLGYAE